MPRRAASGKGGAERVRKSEINLKEEKAKLTKLKAQLYGSDL